MLPEHAARQPRIAADIRPGVAAVGGLPEAGLRAAARHARGKALGLPHRREEAAWIRRIQRQIHRARPLALREHVLPGRAAVARAEHAALAARSPGMPQRRHVHGVGIAWVDAHRPMWRVSFSPTLLQVRPPSVGAVDAVAVGDVAADVGLAGAGVDDVGRRRAPPRWRPPRPSRRSRRRRFPSRCRRRWSSRRRRRRRRSRRSRARWGGRPPRPRGRRGAGRQSASGAS